jgi:hypothetical protein
MTRRALGRSLAVCLLTAVPSLAEAGPPLICHPFHTGTAQLLTWGNGSSWNSPEPTYDAERLVDDTLRLLSPHAPVLARMENLRRATIYAGRQQRIASALLQALVDRAERTTGRDRVLALFDAGYVIESYKQATHLHRWPAPDRDGYALVMRAIEASGGNPEMEFAASLMADGSRAQEHLQRARRAASAHSLLAHNIDQVWR